MHNYVTRKKPDRQMDSQGFGSFFFYNVQNVRQYENVHTTYMYTLNTQCIYLLKKTTHRLKQNTCMYTLMVFFLTHLKTFFRKSCKKFLILQFYTETTNNLRFGCICMAVSPDLLKPMANIGYGPCYHSTPLLCSCLQFEKFS